MKQFFLSLACLLLLTLQAYAQYDPKAKAILDEMSAKYKRMSSFKADFKYTLSSSTGTLNESFQGVITVKGNKFRLQMGNQEIYNDQTTVWTYLKDSNEITVTDNDPNENEITPTKIYSMYQKGYKYTYVEDQNVDGKACSVVELVPEDRSQDVFKVRLVIEKQSKTLKNWQIFEKNGRKYSFTITGLVADVNVTDTFFQIDKTKYPTASWVDLR